MMFPKLMPSSRVPRVPSSFRASGGRLAAARYVNGAALWLPPGVQPEEAALDDVVQRTVSASIRSDAMAIFEQMARYHPRGPHWYLPLIGVDPACQGHGHGGALMTYALRQCDQDHLPAYLESTNPRNISLYQRHGFQVIGTIQVGASPPLAPMLRPAR